MKLLKMAILGLGVGVIGQPALAWHDHAPKYPKTKKVDVVEKLHGVTINDPYRWLENDIREDKDVAAWVAAQNKITHGYLDTLTARAPINKRMTELWNYSKTGVPEKKGSRYFYTFNTGLQNQSPLYMQQGLNGDRQLLIDPATWSADGTLAMAGYWPNEKGTKVAYAIQDGGSDWRTFKVLDIESGQLTTDTVEWAKFTTLFWHPDGSGFFYARYPAPESGQSMQSLNFNQMVYFHKLGTSQDDDQLIYARPEAKEVSIRPGGIIGDHTLVIYTTNSAVGLGNEIVLYDLETKDEPKVLTSGFEHNHYAVELVDDDLYVQTNDGAPNYKIVKMAVDDASDVTTIVPEKDSVIEDTNIVGGKLLVSYLEDVKSAIYQYGLSGVLDKAIELPGIGTAYGFAGDADDGETFFGFTSYNRAPTIYRYDVASGDSSIFAEPKLAFDPESIEVTQVFYPSKDGTKIPMFIIYKKGMDMTKPQSTILYGYGGFDISLTPGFNPMQLTWVEMGGVYAIANLRGGGEYGKKWHDAGRLNNKQNVFDDFIAAGEFLIQKGLASKATLAISGGSNGGLLVGAVMNQRPDLFAAALPAVGVMDMLRFHKFTAGRFWVSDYGNPDNAADFSNLLTYSPYHNIKAGIDYPAMLITTADRDDRVVPGHSFKYAARMQELQHGNKPRLIRIESRAGHGSGMPTVKRIEGYSDQLAFVAHNTGLKVKP